MGSVPITKNVGVDQVWIKVIQTDKLLWFYLDITQPGALTGGTWGSDEVTK